MRRLVALLFALLIIGFGLSFALLNAQSVTMDYYLGATTMPLSLALTLVLAVGAILGLLAGSGALLRQRRQTATLRRQLASAEKELNELRRLPVRDSA
jgi:putative membrane protein